MEFNCGAQHVVYKKDSEGATFTVREIVFNNMILQHPAFIHNIKLTLENFSNLPRKDDVYILAYSKSGTTWLNEIINLLVHHETSVLLVDKVARMVEACDRNGFQQFERMESPRILNSHLRLKFIPEDILNNNKIIYCIRNPKSVAVSFYHHVSNIKSFDYNGTFKGFLPTFATGLFPEFHGSWFDHVTEYWKALKDKRNVLILFYEDMKKRPLQNIKAIAEFLGLQHEQDFYNKIADVTTFDAMKSREKTEINEALYKNSGTTFCREGEVSGWKTQFTVSQNEMLDVMFEENMKEFPDLKEKIQFV